MRCREFEIRLHERLDQRLDPQGDQQLQTHAGTCPHCQQLLRDHQQILDALAHRQATVMPRNGSSAPLPSPRTGPRVLRRTWSAVFLIACLILLLVSRFIPHALTRGTRPDGNQVARSTLAQPAAKPPTRSAVEVPPASPISLQGNPQEESALWDDWRNLDLRRLLPEAERARLRDTRWLDRVRRVGGSFRPLTNSVTSTFSILKRTWPGTQPRNESGLDQASLPARPDRLA